MIRSLNSNDVYWEQEIYPAWTPLRTYRPFPNQKRGAGVEPHYHDGDEIGPRRLAQIENAAIQEPLGERHGAGGEFTAQGFHPGVVFMDHVNTRRVVVRDRSAVHATPLPHALSAVI